MPLVLHIALIIGCVGVLMLPEPRKILWEFFNPKGSDNG